MVNPTSSAWPGLRSHFGGVGGGLRRTGEKMKKGVKGLSGKMKYDKASWEGLNIFKKNLKNALDNAKIIDEN